ncbi:uncharacterized protein LOC129348689 [Amphiprion ocellaris]|uniref:uncharacterized protein LOC129348689 n=1 Tax=Amphiprion ocellaris TaxID=80972 RepID=UPI0024115BA9|nr:uncharacterized protein LOC129348689 [Amphiprion ocellaris]
MEVSDQGHDEGAGATIPDIIGVPDTEARRAEEDEIEETPQDEVEQTRIQEFLEEAKKRAPTPKKSPTYRYQVVLAGDGWSTWEDAVKQHVQGFNPSLATEELKALMQKSLQEDNSYTSKGFIDNQWQVVLKCPAKPPKKKQEVEEWLVWWSNYLVEVLRAAPMSKATALVSPSAGYDSIVKALAKETGLTAVLVSNKVRATSIQQDLRKHLKAMHQYRARSDGLPAEVDRESTCTRQDSASESEEEEPDGQVGDQEGDEEGDWAGEEPDEDQRSPSPGPSGWNPPDPTPCPSPTWDLSRLTPDTRARAQATEEAVQALKKFNKVYSEKRKKGLEADEAARQLIAYDLLLSLTLLTVVQLPESCRSPL